MSHIPHKGKLNHYDLLFINGNKFAFDSLLLRFNLSSWSYWKLYARHRNRFVWGEYFARCTEPLELSIQVWFIRKRRPTIGCRLVYRKRHIIGGIEFKESDYSHHVYLRFMVSHGGCGSCYRVYCGLGGEYLYLPVNMFHFIYIVLRRMTDNVQKQTKAYWIISSFFQRSTIGTVRSAMDFRWMWVTLWRSLRSMGIGSAVSISGSHGPLVSSQSNTFTLRRWPNPILW